MATLKSEDLMHKGSDAEAKQAVSLSSTPHRTGKILLHEFVPRLNMRSRFCSLEKSVALWTRLTASKSDGDIMLVIQMICEFESVSGIAR